MSKVELFLLTATASDYGLFLSDEDPRKGIWLESGRTLDYYMLRNGVNKCNRELWITGIMGATHAHTRTHVNNAVS